MKKNIVLIFTTILIYTLFVLPFFFMKNAEAVTVSGSNVRTGTVELYFSQTIPSGYLLCDGRAVSRTTYSELFKLIGTTYGAGDGSTTFNLPNFQGRIPVGKNSGTFSTLGKTGGEETHKLTAAEMPSHTHSLTSGTVSTTELVGRMWNLVYQETAYPGSGSGIVSQGVGWTEGAHYGGQGWVTNIDPGFTINLTHNHTISGNTTATGSGSAHNNLQPYIVVNYIIKS